jgi:hypothetical protein
MRKVFKIFVILMSVVVFAWFLCVLITGYPGGDSQWAAGAGVLFLAGSLAVGTLVQKERGKAAFVVALLVLVFVLVGLRLSLLCTLQQGQIGQLYYTGVPIGEVKSSPKFLKRSSLSLVKYWVGPAFWEDHLWQIKSSEGKPYCITADACVWVPPTDYKNFVSSRKGEEFRESDAHQLLAESLAISGIEFSDEELEGTVVEDRKAISERLFEEAFAHLRKSQITLHSLTIRKIESAL